MRVVWVFVPVLGAPILHAPVLALDLLPSFKRPLDGGLIELAVAATGSVATKSLWRTRNRPTPAPTKATTAAITNSSLSPVTKPSRAAPATTPRTDGGTVCR